LFYATNINNVDVLQTWSLNVTVVPGSPDILFISATSSYANCALVTQIPPIYVTLQDLNDEVTYFDDGSNHTLVVSVSNWNLCAKKDFISLTQQR
jgi:hypothetical protein